MSVQEYRQEKAEPERKEPEPAPEVIAPPSNSAAAADLGAQTPKKEEGLLETLAQGGRVGPPSWADPLPTDPGGPSAPGAPNAPGDKSAAPTAPAPDASVAPGQADPKSPTALAWDTLRGGAVVERGDTGAAVRALQQKLRDHGAKIDVDGEFGPKTAAAVRRAQAALGIRVDGQAGPQTSSALDAALSKRKSSRKKTDETPKSDTQKDAPTKAAPTKAAPVEVPKAEAETKPTPPATEKVAPVKVDATSTDPTKKDPAPAIDPAKADPTKVNDPVATSVAVLRRKEGFSNKAFWDENAYRAGYGSDTITDPKTGAVRKVQKGDVVSREQGDADLARRIPQFQAGIEKQVGGPSWDKLDASQKAALTSFAYNYGSLKKDVVAAVKTGDRDKIADAIAAHADDKTKSEREKGVQTKDGKPMNWARRMEEAGIARGTLDPATGKPWKTPPGQTSPQKTAPTPKTETAKTDSPAVPEKTDTPPKTADLPKAPATTEKAPADAPKTPDQVKTPADLQKVPQVPQALDPKNPYHLTDDQREKLHTMATGKLYSGKEHSCVTTVRKSLNDMGLGDGIPKATGSDPNNPRGMMTGMLNSGKWESLPIAGSKTQEINSPGFGKTNANVLSREAYLDAMKKGLVPDGALVFEASKEGGWNYNKGSYGNDVAINRQGTLFNYKSMGGPVAYKSKNIDIVVVIPKAENPPAKVPAAAKAAALPKADTQPAPTPTEKTAAPAKVAPAKVDPAPAKVDPAPAKVDPAPAKVEPAVATMADVTRTAVTPVADTKVDPAKVDPAKVDPAKVDPAKVDPAKVDPAKVDPAKVPPPTETAPAKPFTQLTPREQMAYMAKLMKDNRDLLDANSVSSHMERNMAAQVPAEIDENQRRKTVTQQFTDQAKTLSTKMKDVDLKDPAQVEKLKKGLNEEQLHLLGKVQAGELDLSQMNSKDPATKAAFNEKLTEAGIELKANQYGEMEGLRKRKEAGEKLTKDETARLDKLSGLSTYAGAKMGELWGMSRDRFAEIYAKGNTRFESAQYKQLRDTYISRKKEHDDAAAAFAKDPKNNKDPGETVMAGKKGGIGYFDISKAGQDKIATDGNYDIIANIATSYGAGQIMGGYAKSDYWKGQGVTERLPSIKMPDGTDYTPTFEDLKGTGTHQNPDVTDLKIQMSLAKMVLKKRKTYDPDGKGLANDTIGDDDYIKAYNGSDPGSDIYKHYKSALDQNRPLYDEEKAKLGTDAPAPAPTQKKVQTPDPAVRKVAAVTPELPKAEPAVLKTDVAPAAVVAKAEPEKLATDLGATPAVKTPDVKAVEPAKVEPDAKATPVAATFQEKLDKEYTPLLDKLQKAKTDEERQAAALEVAKWNRANLVNQPDVQAYLARSDVSMEEKTKTMNALAAEVARSEFLSGWSYLGGTGTNSSWETEGKNKGAFPSEYIQSMKTYGSAPAWCTSFAGYAMKEAGFQFNKDAKENQSLFWSGTRLNNWAKTGQTMAGAQLTPTDQLLKDSQTGRVDNNFGTLASSLNAAKDKKGNVVGGQEIAQKFADNNGSFQPGDVLVLNMNAKGASHTVMVESYDPKTGKMTTIEGNAGDKVTARTIDLKNPKDAAAIFGRYRMGAENFMTDDTKAKLAAGTEKGGENAVTAEALLGRARATNLALSTAMVKKGWVNGKDPKATAYTLAGDAATNPDQSTR